MRRSSLSLPLVALAAALAASSSAIAAEPQITTSGQAYADGVRPSTEGFYPLWENTGYVERHREIYLGTNAAHFGILDRVHVGVQPVSFLYRAPNAYAKVSLLNTSRWHVAARAGVFHLMPEAGKAYFSPMYTSRLDNQDFAVWLLPLSLSATYELADWMQLHQSATAMGIYSRSGELVNQVYGGYSVIAELLAKRRHSVLAHLAEVGIWEHDFSMLGASYRYHNAWIDFQLGYFYRFRTDGSQAGPLISLGFLL